MAIIKRITELGTYIDYLIRGNERCSDEVIENVCEADLYNFVLEYGKSNIEKLDYMLKDVDRALFDGFDNCVWNSPYRYPCDENGVEVEAEKIEPEKLYPIEEHLEYIKKHPYFQACDEVEQKDLIEHISESHEDLIINKQSVFFSYNFCYKYVQQFRGIIFNEIERLKQQLDNTKQPKQPKQPKGFTRLFSETEQKNLFKGLTNGGFLPKETVYSNFYYVFGGTETTDFKPLQWMDKVGLLAYFIDNGFADTDGTNLWKITESCFIINGKKPNINTLKNTVSKYKQDCKEKPKNYQKINSIWNGL